MEAVRIEVEQASGCRGVYTWRFVWMDVVYWGQVLGVPAVARERAKQRLDQARASYVRWQQAEVAQVAAENGGMTRPGQGPCPEPPPKDMGTWPCIVCGRRFTREPVCEGCYRDR